MSCINECFGGGGFDGLQKKSSGCMDYASNWCRDNVDLVPVFKQNLIVQFAADWHDGNGYRSVDPASILEMPILRTASSHPSF